MDTYSCCLNTVPWAPKNKAYTQNISAATALLSHPEQVDAALQALTDEDVVVLTFAGERIISMRTPQGRYTLNLNYPAMASLDLGKNPCSFVVLDSYAQAARLKSLGLKKLVESVRLQERLLGRPAFSSDTIDTDRLLNSYMSNKKKLVQANRMTTYELMR